MLREGHPLRRSDVWVRKRSWENAVYDSEHSQLHILNETAQAVWELCDGQTRPDEMVEAICELYGLSPHRVDEDVRRILAEFEEAHLIAWVP